MHKISSKTTLSVLLLATTLLLVPGCYLDFPVYDERIKDMTVPELIEAAKGKTDISPTAAVIAISINAKNPEEEVAALIETLKSEIDAVRMRSALALARLGPDAKEAVPTLIEALKDEHWLVRSMSAEALSKIGPDAREAVPALIETMKTDFANQFNALEALAQIGPAAEPALLETLNHEKSHVRLAAWHALELIDPEAYTTEKMWDHIDRNADGENI